MEDQKTIIVIDKETLLFLASAIIVAGMASNDSTVCPSETHAIVARCAAQSLLDSILKN